MNSSSIRRGRFSTRDSIVIIGPLDFSDGNLQALVDAFLGEKATSIVIDLREATYMTSTGIAGLFKIVKRFREVNGSVSIVGATPDMAELIVLSRLDRYLTLE